VLQVWIDGALVVDRSDLAFRKYNNVSIDTMTLESHFGGSSDSFRAKKTEVNASRKGEGTGWRTGK